MVYKGLCDQATTTLQQKRQKGNAAECNDEYLKL